VFIHIGENIFVSDKLCIGIFNVASLRLSGDNTWLILKVSETDRVLALNDDNSFKSSKVSPFTVIGRTELNSDILWSRLND
jgi:hypothetical protein